MSRNKEKRQQKSTPVDGIIVPIKFYCPICKGHYKEMMDQGHIYRMPKYMTMPDGKRRSVYLNEDTIIKAHSSCAQRYANHVRSKQDPAKKIITGV